MTLVDLVRHLGTTCTVLTLGEAAMVLLWLRDGETPGLRGLRRLCTLVLAMTLIQGAGDILYWLGWLPLTYARLATRAGVCVGMTLFLRWLLWGPVGRPPVRDKGR